MDVPDFRLGPARTVLHSRHLFKLGTITQMNTSFSKRLHLKKKKTKGIN